METQLCSICKERKAFKKVISDSEGDFFFVCKKKKCADKLYDDLVEKGSEEQREFVRKLKWDSSQYQGRSYDKVKRDEKVAMYTFIFFLAALFGFVVYTVATNVF